MKVSPGEREVLRKLAGETAEIAALPVQAETIRLWKGLNGLKPERPMVMIDQIPWHEMEVDGELTPVCADGVLRPIEVGLRRTLYKWHHMRADMVVEPVVGVPKIITGNDFGLGVVEHRVVQDPNNDVVGHEYLDQLADEEDVQKILTPRICLDREATAEREEMAHEIFDGILEVCMQGVIPNFALWDRIITWRGAQNALLDLVLRPEHSHKILIRYAEAMMSMLDQLEEQGLLGPHQSLIHCTGSYTHELPAPGYDPAKARASDLWTCGMAQIFSSVSPQMHQEFELDYAQPWYERFGMVYYGCCEPLHDKVDIIRKIPHVRKVSMSPWVDQHRGAERLAPDLVFSRKPSPAFLAPDSWNPQAVEKDLRDTVEICARAGCPVELILKDISTVRYEPGRLWEWWEIARRVVGA